MRKSRTIGLLNGPNLNLLGARNPEIYGGKGLGQIEAELRAEAAQSDHLLWCFQSNSESGFIQAVHAARWSCCGLIINPGGFSHTSIALRDALELFEGPIAEVHLSNIYAREPFRHHSYATEVSTFSIVGKGPSGYSEALAGIVQRLNSADTTAANQLSSS